MRALSFGLAMLTLVLAVTASAGGREYRFVCEDVLGDGSQAPINCDRVVSAVLDELDPSTSVEAAVIWAFTGCPPGATCALRLRSEPPPTRFSAIAGIRLANGSESVWVVDDVFMTTLSPAPIGGYEADWLIDGLLNSVAASRSP